MNEVDKVQAALEEAQRHAWEQAKEELKRLAKQPTRSKPFPIYTKDGYTTKYAGKKNQLGRRTWMAVVGPVPKGHEVLDYLPPGCSLATWDAPGATGETCVWFAFPVLVHHQTLRKIIGKAGLEYVYIRGCTYKEVLEHVNKNGVNKVYKI